MKKNFKKHLYCIIINKSTELSDVDNMMQSIKPFGFRKIYYVADRCSDDFNSYLKNYSLENLVCIFNYEGEGRKTSSLRNIPVKTIMEEDSLASIVFLDGDRFVTSYKEFDNTKNWVFNVEGNDSTVILEDDKFEVDNKYYSAGIHLSNKTIVNLLETYGYIFDESLEQTWGIEDLDLGNRLIKFREDYQDLDFDYQYADGIKLAGNYNYGYKSQAEEVFNVAKLISLEMMRDSYF